MWHTRFVAKRPRDPVQLAKQVFDIAIGDAEDTVSEAKQPHPRNAKADYKGARRALKALPQRGCDGSFKQTASLRKSKTHCNGGDPCRLL